MILALFLIGISWEQEKHKMPSCSQFLKELHYKIYLLGVKEDIERDAIFTRMRFTDDEEHKLLMKQNFSRN